MTITDNVFTTNGSVTLLDMNFGRLSLPDHSLILTDLTISNNNLVEGFFSFMLDIYKIENIEINNIVFQNHH